MLFNKFNSTAAITALCSLFLVACDSGKPDDKLGIEHITKAESVAGEYKAANIKRVNGWQEPDAKYTVEYEYQFIAEIDYEPFVQSYIDAYEKNPEGNFGTGFESLNYKFVTLAAITDREPGGFGFIGIARTNLKQDENGRFYLAAGERIKNGNISEKFRDYIKQDTNEEYQKHRNLLYAMANVEIKGFKPETKKGDVIMNRNWKLLFKKTENGWQVAQ